VCGLNTDVHHIESGLNTDNSIERVGLIGSVCVYVCMCVYVCVCMYVCVCVCVWVFVYMCVYMYVCIYGSVCGSVVLW
jgi:hypothetical protein